MAKAGAWGFVKSAVDSQLGFEIPWNSPAEIFLHKLFNIKYLA